MSNSGVKDLKTFVDNEELNYRQMIQYAELEVKHIKVMK